MTLIQVILSTGILLIGIYSYKRFHTSYIDALFICLFVVAGSTLTFFPQVSSSVAQVLGVGRGADLIFYLCILFFCFMLLKLYAKVRRLEQILTQMLREKTIAEAKDLTIGKS
jgi:small membrane protein